MEDDRTATNEPPPPPPPPLFKLSMNSVKFWTTSGLSGVAIILSRIVASWDFVVFRAESSSVRFSAGAVTDEKTVWINGATPRVNRTKKINISETKQIENCFSFF